jgi:hypothetical protein
VRERSNPPRIPNTLPPTQQTRRTGELLARVHGSAPAAHLAVRLQLAGHVERTGQRHQDLRACACAAGTVTPRGLQSTHFTFQAMGNEAPSRATTTAQQTGTTSPTVSAALQVIERVVRVAELGPRQLEVAQVA